MKNLVRHWLVIAAVLFSGILNAGMLSAPVSAQEVASVQQLKDEAMKAVQGGDFDRTMQLLTQAASLSPDPSVAQMKTWLSQFAAQRQVFTTERRKEYDKAVANVQKLLQHGKDGFAIDAAAKAYLLTDDKTAFRKEKWVDDLVASTTVLAEKYRQSEQWLKALRLYSDLSSIEPANPQWKEKLKSASRRMRLLALYNPDEFKARQEAETKEREEAEAIVKPTTRPTTKPKDDDEEKLESYKIDWHDTLKGVQFDMLWDALEDARTNYYREVNYRQMMNGGLKSLEAIATTQGLEKAFPLLSDQTKRQAFLEAIRKGQAEMAEAGDNGEKLAARTVLAELRAANRASIALPEEVLVSEFSDGALAELDPFSNIIWPSDLEEFNKTTQGEFSGVGVQIQSDDDGSLRVVSPLEDTPAYKAGLKAGDIITHVNGKNIKGITVNQAVKKITGPVGTDVTLTVRSPDGNAKDYTIRRETIKVASIKGWSHRPTGGWDYFVDPKEKIGYVRLTNFTRTTSDDLDKAMEDMQTDGVRALILDLRYNPGGLLPSAIDVVDKFIKQGVIVSTRADRDTPNQPTVATAKGDGQETKLPMVVLVNQYSASASEIVSGALKDQHRAIIIGERSFGKGSVQMLFPISGRTAYLKLTTSHYYLPSGRCLHREENSTSWGVDPDVAIEMTPEQMRSALDVRQELDVLRDASDPTTVPSRLLKREDVPAVVREAIAKKDSLLVDPQLSAAVLVLRLQLAGGTKL